MILWMPPEKRVVTGAPIPEVTEDMLRQMERAAYREGWRLWWESNRD